MPGGKMGSAPPAGVDLKRKGRGGEGSKLSDVRWGVILTRGWKLLGFFKPLVLAYCVFMLLQTVVTNQTNKVFGDLTNILHRLAPQESQEKPAAKAPAPDVQAQKPPETPAAEKAATEKADLLSTSVWWAFLALASLFMHMPLRWVGTKLDLSLSNKLRSQLFGRLLRQSPDFYHTHESGELNAVVNQFTVESSVTLRQVSLDMLLQLASLAYTVGMLMQSFTMKNAQHTFFGLPPAAVPVLITLIAFVSPWISGKLSNMVRDVSRDLQEKMVALNSLATGAMQSPDEIQAMEAEPLFTEKYDKQLKALLKSRVNQTMTMEKMGLYSGLPGWVVQVVMLVFSIYFASTSGDKDAAGKVVTIFLLTPQLMLPIGALSGYLIMAGSAWPSIETINGMLELRRRREEESGTVRVDKVEPTITARNVTFSYSPDGRKIFDDISFDVPPGKITGFVARMGQGKTTFFKLALRFYDPQQGQILLGGRPVADYASDNLYRHIAMMSQFPAFFYDTLRANMQMAKPDATDEEIRAISEKTGVWKILEAGVKGNPLDQEFAAARRLSGGQKKLLALTRCLLRNPAVLFLDEPTVGMDNKEKFSMLEIIKEALKGHTVMVVDHDLRWLMPFCNYFIVLDNGKIAEQGTADELLARGGLFSELYHAEDAKPESAAQAPPSGPPQMAGMAGGRPPGH